MLLILYALKTTLLTSAMGLFLPTHAHGIASSVNPSVVKEKQV